MFDYNYNSYINSFNRLESSIIHKLSFNLIKHHKVSLNLFELLFKPASNIKIFDLKFNFEKKFKICSKKLKIRVHSVWSIIFWTFWSSTLLLTTDLILIEFISAFQKRAKTGRFDEKAQFSLQTCQNKIQK